MGVGECSLFACTIHENHAKFSKLKNLPTMSVFKIFETQPRLIRSDVSKILRHLAGLFPETFFTGQLYPRNYPFDNGCQCPIFVKSLRIIY